MSTKQTKQATGHAKKQNKSTNIRPQTMAELLEQVAKPIVVPQVGERITGTIVSKDNDELVLDIGAKTLAAVSDRELDIAQDYVRDLEVGDKLEATVFSSENEHGYIQLSLRQAAVDARWDYFAEALDEDRELAAHGLETNKGGMIVKVNDVRGFVPSSQFGKEYIGNIDQLIGQDFKVKAIEVDREQNRLIFSERHVSEAEELALRESALDVVESGEVYEGVVSGVMHFGLFVTVEIPIDDEDKLGNIEGLVHISEISWEKVDHPKNYHQVGDRIKVKVLGIDDKTNKLNLSIKQLSTDPWQGLDKEYPVGTTLTGIVTRIEPFGVFVNVKEGVDGLMHTSKLNPDKTYQEDDEVTVTVESVDPERRRMSLSPVLTELPVGYK